MGLPQKLTQKIIGMILLQVVVTGICKIYSPESALMDIWMGINICIGIAGLLILAFYLITD